MHTDSNRWMVWLYVCLGLAGYSAISHAADVRSYSVLKGIYYAQGNTGQPTLLSNNAFAVQAVVDVPSGGAVNGGILTAPGGREEALGRDGNDWEYRKRYDVRAKLDDNFPDGPFTLTIMAANDGTKTPVLSVTGGSYPPAPRVANMTAGQRINAAGYFLLEWDAWPAGTRNDFIQLRIEDSSGARVFETADWGEAEALNGTASFALIPPQTLKPSQSYVATLWFQKQTSRNQNGYPGAIGTGGYYTRTSFGLRTSAAGEPDVNSFEFSKGRSFELTNATTLIPEPENAFIFQAQADGAANGAILQSTLTLPGGTVLTLEPDKDLRDYEIKESLASLEALDAKYPEGNYLFQFNTAHNGTKQVTLRILTCPYPEAPRLLNFDPLQPVRASQDLVLTWAPWAEGKEHDFIQLRIEDKGERVWESPDYTKNNALNGRATRVTIPAGTLIPGKKHNARLTFKKFVALDTASYPGALGIGSYFARTKFEIQAAEPDVKELTLFKGLEWVQRSSGEPLPHPEEHAMLACTVEASATQAISGVTITTPAGTRLPLALQSDGLTWAARFGAVDLAALNAIKPDGAYLFTIDTAHDGQQRVKLSLTGAAYPNAPRIQNWPELQAVDTNDFVFFDWDSFVGGAANDFILVQLFDPTGEQVFDSNQYGSNDAMDGSGTYIRIGKKNFESPGVYTGEVLFQKMTFLSHTNLPGSDVYGGYSARTRFPVATRGPGNPPQVTISATPGSTSPVLTFSALPGGRYCVESSTDLVHWVPMGELTASQGEVKFASPPPPPQSGCCFYRAVLMP